MFRSISTGILAKSGGLEGSPWAIIDVDISLKFATKNVSATQKDGSSP